MKTIRIFIGSSITELELERAKLMSFIQGLNNQYHQRGIFIEGYICEETPNSMRTGGSQAMHNDYIRDHADATIFMFYHHAGEFTMKELELARQAFLEQGKPHVYIFFKSVNNAPDISEEIQKAVSLVFEDYGHYYKMFDDVDTVKLELLQFLTDLLPGKGELLVKNGAVYMNGELVKDISAANIFAYQNNQQLNSLKEQINELEELMRDAGDKGDGRTVSRISEKVSELKKQYTELEADILDILRYFYEKNISGDKPDKTIEQALRYLEFGKIDMAKAIIPQEDLDNMAQSIANRRALSEVMFREEEETLLSHTKARIKILKLDVKNPNRFAEIEHAYQTAFDAALRNNDSIFIAEYIFFLSIHFQKTRAGLIAEMYYYKLLDSARRKDNMTESEQSDILLTAYTIGSLSFENNNDLDHRQLEIQKKLECLLENDSLKTDEDVLAEAHKFLGSLYFSSKVDRAEDMLLKSLEIYQRLTENNSEAYDSHLADSFSMLGHLYFNSGRESEAETCYQKALGIQKRLPESEDNQCRMADTCFFLGLIYDFGRQFDKAEAMYLESLEIYHRFAENIKWDARALLLAHICTLVGIFYEDRKKADKAEPLYLEAHEIYSNLMEVFGRDAFECDYAKTCRYLGDYYFNANNDKADKAEVFLLQALESYRHLAEEVNRDLYAPYVKATYSKLLMLYYKNDKQQEYDDLLREDYINIYLKRKPKLELSFRDRFANFVRFHRINTKIRFHRFLHKGYFFLRRTGRKLHGIKNWIRRCFLRIKYRFHRTK